MKRVKKIDPTLANMMTDEDKTQMQETIMDMLIDATYSRYDKPMNQFVMKPRTFFTTNDLVNVEMGIISKAKALSNSPPEQQAQLKGQIAQLYQQMGVITSALALDPSNLTVASQSVNIFQRELAEATDDPEVQQLNQQALKPIVERLQFYQPAPANATSTTSAPAPASAPAPVASAPPPPPVVMTTAQLPQSIPGDERSGMFKNLLSAFFSGNSQEQINNGDVDFSDMVKICMFYDKEQMKQFQSEYDERRREPEKQQEPDDGIYFDEEEKQRAEAKAKALEEPQKQKEGAGVFGGNNSSGDDLLHDFAMYLFKDYHNANKNDTLCNGLADWMESTADGNRHFRVVEYERPDNSVVVRAEPLLGVQLHEIAINTPKTRLHDELTAFFGDVDKNPASVQHVPSAWEKIFIVRAKELIAQKQDKKNNLGMFLPRIDEWIAKSSEPKIATSQDYDINNDGLLLFNEIISRDFMDEGNERKALTVYCRNPIVMYNELYAEDMGGYYFFVRFYGEGTFLQYLLTSYVVSYKLQKQNMKEFENSRFSFLFSKLFNPPTSDERKMVSYVDFCGFVLLNGDKNDSLYNELIKRLKEIQRNQPSQQVQDEIKSIFNSLNGSNAEASPQANNDEDARFFTPDSTATPTPTPQPAQSTAQPDQPIAPPPPNFDDEQPEQGLLSKAKSALSSFFGKSEDVPPANPQAPLMITAPPPKVEKVKEEPQAPPAPPKPQNNVVDAWMNGLKTSINSGKNLQSKLANVAGYLKNNTYNGPSNNSTVEIGTEIIGLLSAIKSTNVKADKIEQADKDAINAFGNYAKNAPYDIKLADVRDKAVAQIQKIIGDATSGQAPPATTGSGFSSRKARKPKPKAKHAPQSKFDDVIRFLLA